MSQEQPDRENNTPITNLFHMDPPNEKECPTQQNRPPVLRNTNFPDTPATDLQGHFAGETAPVPFSPTNPPETPSLTSYRLMEGRVRKQLEFQEVMNSNITKQLESHSEQTATFSVNMLTMISTMNAKLAEFKKSNLVAEANMKLL